MRSSYWMKIQNDIISLAAHPFKLFCAEPSWLLLL
jgi:hypothetical protein